MKTVLKIFFVGVFLVMSYGTIRASLDRNVMLALQELGPDPWFQVTLMDTYFAFLTVWLWVAYKESSWAARIFWLISILVFGNFAIAVYFLIQLFRLKAGESLTNFWFRKPSA